MNPLLRFRLALPAIRRAAGRMLVTALIPAVAGPPPTAHAADDPRVIVFGTVARLTPRGAPSQGLDDAVIIQELAELVANAAGLPFRIVEKKTFPEVMAAFESGEIDVLPSLARLPERQGRMLFSQRHSTSTLAVFTREATRVPHSIADVAALKLTVAESTMALSYIQNKGWGAQTQIMRTPEAAMQEVLAGRADACLSSQLVGHVALKKIGREGALVPSYVMPDYTIDLCMAVRLSDAHLLEQLNDGLLVASERGDLRRHREKWLPAFESYWLARPNVRRWLGFGGAGLGLAGFLSWLWYRFRLRAERRETEKVTRLVAERTAELAAANEQLRASEELFSAAFRASPDALCVTREGDGRVIDVNDGFTRILGYSRAEAIGRTWLDLGIWVQPEERAAVFTSLRTQDRVRDVARRFRRKDRQEIEGLFSIECTTIGGTRCLVSLLRDITEQKRAAAERLREQEFNEAILGTVDGLIIVLDPQGRIVRFNPACERLTGWKSAEVTGRMAWDFLFPAEQVPAVRKSIDALASGMFSNRLENHWLTRSGERRWIVWANSALRDAAGRIELIVGTGVDITWRQQAEHELRQLNAELETRVQERTRELGARVEQVERLNAELESFSYSVSHDLRAPLRNISGFLELFGRRVKGQLDPEAEHFASVITAEAKRMALLIDDLLSFSRVGRTEMRQQPVALTALIAQVRETLQPEMGDRVITWHVAPLPTVLGDPGLLRQVFANVLGNAVKYTRHTPAARIEIGVITSAANDGMTTLFVRDNGAGFNPKYQDKLFGVFQRLHNVRDFEGTGIGLANVKRIVTRHGGRVWAEGAVNQGATFSFTLKLAPA